MLSQLGGGGRCATLVGGAKDTPKHPTVTGQPPTQSHLAPDFRTPRLRHHGLEGTCLVHNPLFLATKGEKCITLTSLRKTVPSVLCPMPLARVRAGKGEEALPTSPSRSTFLSGAERIELGVWFRVSSTIPAFGELIFD